MREKRLLKDLQMLTELDQSSDLIEVQHTGDPPLKYIVTYHCTSLIWLEGSSSPSYANRHQLEIYLHREYPRRPPALKWLTDIFHPNVMPPKKNGGVCIGGWSAAETLDNLCLRIGEMLQYKSFNLDDPLNEEAAEWAKEHLDSFPVDRRQLLKQR